MLAEDTFRKHIAVNHPEMKTLVRVMKQAVKDPDYIFVSKLRKDRDIYIKMGRVRGFSELGAKVIVEFPDPSSGLVVSGWLVRGPSQSDASGGLRYEKPRRK
ncbi:MAG: hypothetical protein ACM3ZU_01615 [Bacteroidota bacterium]